MKIFKIIFGVGLILLGIYGVFLYIPTITVTEFIAVWFCVFLTVVGGFIMASGLRKDRREFTRAFKFDNH